MVNAAAQYRRALEKKLRCGSETKKRLLDGFDQTLAVYLEERGEPTMDDLTAAFGPPEEMADTLMEGVTEQEKEQYHKTTLCLRIITSVLLALFIAFTVWLYFFKEVGLTYNDGAGIIDRTSETTSIIEEGDDLQ